MTGSEPAPDRFDLQAQAWIDNPATVRVFEALEAAGGPDCVRFVGGCVRDAVVGRPVGDIDLATTLEPTAVIDALTAAGLRSIPTGLSHGTVTAVSDGRPHEITTLRRDVSTDGRHAEVVFSSDWAEDAARRDFRLNALYATRDGRIVDPTGHGLADARAGRVVFVGDAARRIEEDYLRILRLFRFHAWYGRGPLDAQALDACARHRDGLSRLSAERVSKEFLRLLAAPDPRPAVRAMAASGVLTALRPELDAGPLFEAMVDLTGDETLRLSALLPPDPQVVRGVAEALRLPNVMRDRLAAAVEAPFQADPDPVRIRACVYRDGRQAVLDRLSRRMARTGADLSAQATLARDWPLPRMPIGGREVADAGVPPGPATGRVLARFERDWIASDFAPDGHSERLSRAVEAERA